MTAPHLDDAAVRAVLTHPMALGAAREAARLAAAGEVAVSRTSVRSGDAWMRILVAALPGRDEIGYKEFHVSTDPPSIRYVCRLFRMSTGDPIGSVDAYQITRWRTAATATLAVRHVFGRDPIRVGFVGSGGETQQGLRTLAAECELAEVRVFSPRPESRERFVTDMQLETGIPVRAVESVAACARGVDLVYSATNSSTVVVRRRDLPGVRMLATLGSTMPVQREVEGAAFADAAPLIVDTREAFSESGDLIDAAQIGDDHRAGAIMLGHFLTTPHRDDDLTIYKSIGSAEQDLVLASTLLERAATS